MSISPPDNFPNLFLQKHSLLLKNFPPSPPPITATFSHYLKTNEVPPEWAIPLVKSAVQGAHQEFTNLESLLFDIQSLKTVVEGRMKEYDTFRIQHTRVCSPMRILPTEILTAIFHLCLYPEGEGGLDLLEHEAHTDDPPWVFGQVCRRWRSICIETPSLWENEIGNAPLRLNSWGVLELKKALLLCPPFFLPLALDSIRGQHTLAERRELKPLLSQIGELILNFVTQADLLYLSDNYNGAFDKLKKLRVKLRDSDDAYDSVIPFSVFQKVSSLYISCGLVRYDSHSLIHGELECIKRFGLPGSWSNLTIFEAEWLPAHYLYHILQSAPSLTECRFDYIPGIDDERAVEKILHPNLRALSLWSTLTPWLPNTHLDAICLPALKTLHILDYRTFSKTSSFMQFIGHMSSSLTELILSPFLPQELLDSLIGSCCQLRRFHLRTVTNQTLVNLTIRLDGVGRSNFLPVLRTLTLKPPPDIGLLLDMVKSRTFESGSPAHTLGLQPLEEVCLELSTGRTGNFREIYCILQDMDVERYDLLESIIGEFDEFNEEPRAIGAMDIFDKLDRGLAPNEVYYLTVSHFFNAYCFPWLSLLTQWFQRAQSVTYFLNYVLNGEDIDDQTRERARKVGEEWPQVVREYTKVPRWYEVYSDETEQCHEAQMVYRTGVKQMDSKDTFVGQLFPQTR